MPDLLIELLSEEIPARMQARAADDLRRLVTDGLVEAGLTYAHAGAFVTPRRLTLHVEGLTDRSPDSREDRKGPRVSAPDKAVEGFARGAGVARDALVARDTGKGEVWFAVIDRKGRPASDIVAEVLERTIRDFPWPKSMRWGRGTLRWVRPLHRILCLLTREDGAQIVPLDVDGIVAGDVTEGHRFMAPEPFRVTGFEDYAARLRRAFVVLDADERAETIRNAAQNAAFALGLEVVEDNALLAEVAGLVEWPVVLTGAIEERFLTLPPEVLQTSMREHQKFFSLRDREGRIVRFVTVANRETADDGATILAGNQRVLSARLSDAAFFWANDLRVARAGMGPWLDKLRDVTFHAKLGSQAERIDRIAALAREIAGDVGADPDLAEQAARFAKADLASEMVYEFPELQGVMGRYYAAEAGLPPEVAQAAQDHYAPLGPSDAVPTAPVSVAVALADKIDTLTGFWAIDEKPTGSKDPYALRRAALGVIRLIIELDIRIDMSEVFYRSRMLSDRTILSLTEQDKLTELEQVMSFLNIQTRADLEKIQNRLSREQAKQIRSPEWENLTFEEAQEKLEDLLRVGRIENAAADAIAAKTSTLAFLHDRLKVHLREQGIRHDVIDACLAMPGNDDLTLLVRRAEALEAFLRTEDGANLVQGFRRANNILTQAEEADGVEYSYGADVKYAETDEERALFAALDAAQPKIDAAMKAEDFGAAMTALAGLRAPIDAFFDGVQVNTDSQILRRNRLNLLSRIRRLCLDVADLTRLQG
ncbi:hypothetical protein OCGS_1134 [Oceaniovalibus guishaninsula JLT2003]|uniref:Glycine--tRNA ligase beta subunit n=1 Tax=Oceaniovalibus guishaninsula JLT2003 TaxID=1231392 RepID=K2GQ19_9RHOB|nr:glycine--tRNA ligase subunit beta [Oceaniovalibus guishaninsula]EKE44751.1 hypothetical protein OCGS_1134 [Oceaniovalibus guishaninsula JLT2003]